MFIIRMYMYMYVYLYIHVCMYIRCTLSVSSQSLVATQQYINHTSAILKHQQKLLSASGDPVTPVMHSLSPPTTKYPHSAHPHARQKLMFNPSCPANGPLSQDSVVAGNLMVSEMSPQMAGMESTSIIL